MAQIQIPDTLFAELCRYHLMGPEYADENHIREQLSDKLKRAAARQHYTETLIDRQTNGSVTEP